MNNTLYPWQEECLTAWFANNCRGIVQAVTGSGKTLLALEAAHRLENTLNQKLNVKIVVPTAALMRQWEKAVNQFFSASVQKVGLRGNGCKDQTDCPYMIYVINSARYELARRILSELKRGEAVLLIADECHHYKSGQNQLIFEFLPYIDDYRRHFFSLGLSATLPSGEDGRYLFSVLGRKIYSYEMEKALVMRTICPYDIFHISLPFKPGERVEYNEFTDKMNHLYANLLQVCPSLNKTHKRERFEILRELSSSKNLRTADMAFSYIMLSYQRKNLVCLASARISCACALIKRLDPNEKIIVFGERIVQADELYRILQKQYPERTGRIHSQMGAQANKNVLERFLVGDIRILISCKSIDEGIDIPDASTAIILSGTSAQRQRIQRLGRIVRKKEGKDRASLYYLHIEETSEDGCFLPDSKNIRIFDLEYRPDKEDFLWPDYDKKAARLLALVKNAGTEMKKRNEILRCLQLGSVRADWMLDDQELVERMNKARYASEKNYWNCMKKLKEERDG